MSLLVPPSIQAGGELNATMHVENGSNTPVTDPGCQLSNTRHALTPVAQPDARVIRDEELKLEIGRVHEENLFVYGADKIWAQLNRERITVARCRPSSGSCATLASPERVGGPVAARRNPSWSTVSSVFVMDIPGFSGPEGPLRAFADCAVVPSPPSAELADIAIATAGTVQDLLGWEPRVALVSFSTKASGDAPSVTRSREALDFIRARAPSLAVEGELQLDAAVAARKVAGTSPVAGRANRVLTTPPTEVSRCHRGDERRANPRYDPTVDPWAACTAGRRWAHG